MKLSSNSWKKYATKEALATLGVGVLYPFGWLKRPKTNRNYSKDSHSVIFIHGFMANRSCFAPIIAYLKVHGVKNIDSFEYDTRRGIEQASLDLKSFIKANVRGGSIDLVCHSLGGVVAKNYVEFLGGNRKTHRCITIGSPHSGTYNAYWAPQKTAYDLRPESRFMKRLSRHEELSHPEKFLSISGSSDNIILPRDSALLTEQHHEIAGAGHLGLLWSPSTMKLVLSGLSPKAFLA